MRFNERTGGNNRIHPLAETHELACNTNRFGRIHTRLPILFNL